MESSYPLLAAEHVRLRSLEPEDLELLYTIENDPQLWDIGMSRRPYSRYALRLYIAQQPHDIYQGNELRLVIEERATAKGIGLIDLTNFSPTDQLAEIGIAILAEKRGYGYGQQAIGALERYSCQVLHIRQLYAHVLSRYNPAAHRLFQEAGFQPVAELPAWHLYRGKYEAVTVYVKNIEKNAR